MKIGEIWRRKNDNVKIKIVEIIYTTPKKDEEFDCLGTLIEAITFVESRKKKKSDGLDKLTYIVDELYKDYFVKFVFCKDKSRNELTIPRKIFLRLFEKVGKK